MRDQKANAKVHSLIGDIRRRWKRRAILQGGALTLLTLLCVATLLLLMRFFWSSPNQLMIVTAVIGFLILVAVLFKFLIQPLSRKIDDKQIALYVEEHVPQLEDRLNSAVEIQSSEVLKPSEQSIINKLMDDTASRTKNISLDAVVDGKRQRYLSYGAGFALFLFLLLGYNAWDKVSFQNGGLSFAALATEEKAFMTISPGSVEIEKGDSQEIIASFAERIEQDVIMNFKSGEGEWQQEVMRTGMEATGYLKEFIDVQEPIQYFIDYGEDKSDLFTITLYEFPRVSQIDQRYDYPSYTRRAPRFEKDAGDLRGLKGSTVTLDIQTTGNSTQAELVLDSGAKVALKSLGQGKFQGSLVLNQDDFYTIRLTDASSKNNKFPEEFLVTALEDEPPYILITDPQRDVRANAIEEVLVAVEIEDDFGVKDARLKYSVNGDEEQSIPLMSPSDEVLEEVEGEHLFYLEDFSLQPGDVISYYVEAEDHLVENPEASDMYFIEVIPFDQKFSQANNPGGGQGGGGQPSALVLNQQQIISATWKLHRERDDMEVEEFEESKNALVQAQFNLKNNIEERINSTAFSLELQMNEDNRKIVDYLREATVEMDAAMKELTQGKLHPALTPERKALNKLLRADALNKVRQVANQQNQQGGGGGGGSTEERMTELMDLELDISKDKYETQQQSSGQQSQQDQEVDEAMQRVRDLARKQENLANQARQEERTGEDKKRFIDQLKRDQDELRRQTESLADDLQQMSRENQQISRQMDEQLKRVAENMKEAEQALSRGDSQEAMSKQQQAVNELQRLQEQLGRQGSDNVRERAEDLAKGYKQFRDREEMLGKEVRERAEKMAEEGKVPDANELKRLQRQRDNQLNELDRLQEQTDDLQDLTQRENPEIAKNAKNLIRRMQREELEDNMQNSKRSIDEGWLDLAGRFQDEIESTLDRMEDDVRSFVNTLPEGEGENVAEALQEVRDLMEQMQRVNEEAEEMQQGQSQGSQRGQAGSQEEGQEGDPNAERQESAQGQNGQQPGQGRGQGRDGRSENARMERQMDQARESLERLQEQLEGNRSAQRALRRIQSQITDADGTGVRLEGDSAKKFFDEETFDSLSQIEMDLAQKLDQMEIEKKLFGSRKGDVPPEFRERVDKYYESLSKGKKR